MILSNDKVDDKYRITMKTDNCNKMYCFLNQLNTYKKININQIPMDLITTMAMEMVAVDFQNPENRESQSVRNDKKHIM